MPNYKRGTDLKHCPDGCEHAILDTSNGDGWARPYYQIVCAAKGADTCPREQASTVDKLIADYGGPLINPADAAKLSVERMSRKRADYPDEICATCRYYTSQKRHCTAIDAFIGGHFYCGYWRERANE